MCIPLVSHSTVTHYINPFISCTSKSINLHVHMHFRSEMKSYKAQMIEIHLSHIKHTKCQECLYTGLGGSHMANTGMGLRSRGKVEKVVN